MKTEDFSKVPHIKTEERRKCEDCILKCEDLKINSGWLDTQEYE